MSGDEINFLSLSIAKFLVASCTKKEIEDICFLLRQINNLILPYTIYDKKEDGK